MADANSLDHILPRSEGVQRRGQQRKEALLEAAEILIAECGLDGLSMRELGRRAGLPIASIYHYFPSAQAIVLSLAVKQLKHIESFTNEFLSDANPTDMTAEQLAELATKAVDALAERLARTPAAPAIWNALRSTPALRNIDRNDTLNRAQVIVPFIACLRPHDTAEELTRLAVIFLESTIINVMFALESPEPMRSKFLASLRDYVACTLRGFKQS
ncbi:TetR/AcrR family transcriptional regulator [Acetobacter sp. TBRC 12305]|uniref:TetR/AcrR family transcriptional regulator n=1 Tax=Acetobacter garciniae TaxID=2817435 RepID=A0A939HMD2_9PROT|nr:TetR/AcrR family transcriptional regulator [Acetobacter garciniae]MBX0345283.1 TetR/AcrR family transcriptional regulator [Acetobacter garciniae]